MTIDLLADDPPELRRTDVYGAQPNLHERNSGEGPDFDLRGLLLTLWRRKWLIVGTFIFFLALGFLVASQMAPRYSASAIVLLNPEKLKIVNLEEVLVKQDGQNEGLQDQVEILRSTSLLSQVVEKLNLEQNPAFNSALNHAPPTLLDRMGEIRGQATSLLVDLGVLSPPAKPVAADPEEASRLGALGIVESLRGGLTIRPLPNSRVFRIGFTATDPALAAQVVNAVVDQFIVNQLDAQLQATRSATEWLTDQVQKLQERVRIAENDVELVRAELAQAAGQSSDVTRQQLEAEIAALAASRERRAALESRYASVVDAIEVRPGLRRGFGISQLGDHRKLSQQAERTSRPPSGDQRRRSGPRPRTAVDRGTADRARPQHAHRGFPHCPGDRQRPGQRA